MKVKGEAWNGEKGKGDRLNMVKSVSVTLEGLRQKSGRDRQSSRLIGGGKLNWEDRNIRGGEKPSR